MIGALFWPSQTPAETLAEDASRQADAPEAERKPNGFQPADVYH
jgi:hypothetical protein